MKTSLHDYRVVTDAVAPSVRRLDAFLNARIVEAPTDDDQCLWLTTKLNLKRQLAAVADDEVEALAALFLRRLELPDAA